MTLLEGSIGSVSIEAFLFFLFVIVATVVLGGLVHVLIFRFLKTRINPSLAKVIAKTVMYLVYLVGIFFAFNNILQFNVTASLAALGVLGVAIILPSVPVLQNVVAGFVLSLERDFHEEDIVEFSGEVCKVLDVNLRTTKLRSLSGKIITVPNLMFMTSTAIANHSTGEFSKVSVSVTIASSSDKTKVSEIIKKACSVNPMILPNIPKKELNTVMKLLEVPKSFFSIPKNMDKLKPKILTKEITKDKHSLDVWFWIWDMTKKEEIISSLYDQLQKEFEKEKISFG